MRATLIWHLDLARVHNRDWIRYLLGDLIENEVVDLQGQFCRPYSIVVEDNRSQTPPEFFQAAATTRPIGLFHVFDQYLSFDYDKYQNFDFVIKTHWSSVFDVDRLLVVPIGYESDMPFRQDFVPASRRSLLWSFAGVLKSSRYEMVRALEDMRPNCIHAAETKDQRLPKSRYVELLQSSVFAPCPMGNVIMESFRLYESLEAGCIPILEKRFFIKYYEHLLDSPPLLFVRTWKEAKQKMAELTADPAALDHVQRETREWWQQYKSALRERVQQFVAAGFAPERSSGEGVRVSSMTRLPGWNYAELLRHQSPPALLWRIQRNLLRGRLRVPI